MGIIVTIIIIGLLIGTWGFLLEIEQNYYEREFFTIRREQEEWMSSRFGKEE